MKAPGGQRRRSPVLAHSVVDVVVVVVVVVVTIAGAIAISIILNISSIISISIMIIISAGRRTSYVGRWTSGTGSQTSDDAGRGASDVGRRSPAHTTPTPTPLHLPPAQPTPPWWDKPHLLGIKHSTNVRILSPLSVADRGESPPNVCMVHFDKTGVGGVDRLGGVGRGGRVVGVWG